LTPLNPGPSPGNGGQLETHTCRLHPLERIATTCNLSHTLHFRGVNNTSGFPGFAARASVYLQTPLGGMPAWRIRNPQLQPSSSDCSRVFCNCSQASPIAAGYSCIAADRLQLQPSDDISYSPPTYKTYLGRARCTVHSQTCNCSRVRGAPQVRAADEEALTRPFQVADTLDAAGRCSRDQLRRRWLCWRCARTQLRRRVV